MKSLLRPLVSAFAALALLAGTAHAAADAVSSASLRTDPADPRPVVTVAELDTLVNPFDAFMLRSTIAALKRALPHYALRTVTVADAEAKEQIKLLKPDFIFAPASFRGLTGVEASRIATRRTNLAQSAAKSVGAVFVVRADAPFRTIEDLRGRRIFTGLPTALDGWLAALRELRARGLDPEGFFGAVHHRNNAYPDVLSALLTGAADAAVLPACLLESVRMNGLVRSADLRAINVQSGDLACAHSTGRSIRT